MEEWGWQPNQTEQEKSQYKYVFWEILPAELRNGWLEENVKQKGGVTQQIIVKA